jgi:hypothetical protein
MTASREAIGVAFIVAAAVCEAGNALAESASTTEVGLIASAAASESRDRFALGIVGTSTFPFGDYYVPSLLSLGGVFSYSPRRFCAVGAEVSAFVLAFQSAGSGTPPTSVQDGTMFLPFGEVRTLWAFPVNVFVRVSAGVAAAELKDKSHKAVGVVRVVTGPELRVQHVYFKPFASIVTKVSAYQGEALGFGAEIGATF